MEELFTILGNNPHYIFAFILYILGVALQTFVEVKFIKPKTQEQKNNDLTRSIARLKNKCEKDLAKFKEDTAKLENLEKEKEKNA